MPARTAAVQLAMVTATAIRSAMRQRNSQHNTMACEALAQKSQRRRRRAGRNMPSMSKPAGRPNARRRLRQLALSAAATLVLSFISLSHTVFRIDWHCSARHA